MAHIRVFKHYVRVPYLVLGLIEAVIFFASIYVGAHIRFYDNPHLLNELGDLYPRALLFTFIIQISLLSMGVYQARLPEGFSGTMLRVAVSFLVGSAVLSFMFYIAPSLYMGRGVIAISAAVSFACVWIVRLLFIRFFEDHAMMRRILVLGSGKKAMGLLDRIRSRTSDTIKVVGFVQMPEENCLVENDLLVEADAIHGWCMEHDVDEIVVAVEDRRQGFPIDQLLDCKLDGIPVLEALTFFERETGRVELALLHPSWLVFSDGFNLSSVRNLFVRGFDILSSCLLLLVTWPIMLVAAACIMGEDGVRASLLYKQKRVGFKGKTFYVYKFRSMREDAEKFGAQWAQENDPRITKVGDILRKYRIDELPQIFNVLRGDMGFVGPRPERPQFVDMLSEKNRYFNERHRVKPGITGWAQLNYPYGASEEDAFNKLEYDLYYVKNHSLLLDLLILIRTVEVILFGKGAR